MRFKKYNLFQVMICLLLVLTISPVMSNPSAMTSKPTVESAAGDDDIYVGYLDNGMEIVLVPNHSVPMVACNIIIKAGAREESWETWGAAHFLEHLLFNGTVNRTQEEIYEEFDLIGAYHNAHTGSHFTDFMLLAPRENFQRGFEILADMVFMSNLPEKKFEKERGIVMEEIARYASYGYNSDQPFKEWLFGDKALARDVLGTVESISRLERDSVLAFYHRWFVPNNMMLFVSGDFRSDTLLGWLQESLSIYRPHQLPSHVKHAPPDYSMLSERGLQSIKVSGKNRILKVALPIPAPGLPEYPTAMMISMMLDRFIDDNLPPGLKGNVSSSFDPDYAYMEISLSGTSDGMSGEEMSSVLDGLLEAFTKHKPRDEDISALALRYRADQIFTSEKLHYYGIMNAVYWSLVPWMEFQSWEKRLASIKPRALTQLARRLFTAQDLAVLVLEPSTIPSPVLPLKRDRKQIVRKVLNNGLSIAVRSDPSAKVFAMHILIKDRWKWDGKNQPGSVDLLHRIITEDDSRSIPLDRQLDRLAATLKTVDSPFIPYDDYYTTPDYSFVRFEILPENWEEGVALVVDRMSSLPSKAECLESAKSGSVNAASRSARSATATGRSKLRKRLFPGSALSASVYGDVEGITLEGLSDLRAKYFHPGNLIISVSGPVDPQTVIAGIEESFAKLKANTDGSPVISATIARLGDLIPESNFRDSVDAGMMQGAVVMGKRIWKIEENDIAALAIANAYLNNRLGMVLREERGLAYGLSSSVMMRRADDGVIWAYWEISMGTRPENLVLAEDGILELIDKLATHQFTSSEVEKLVNAVNGRLLMRDMPRIGQAYAMGVGEFFWNDPERRKNISELLKQLTPEDVEAAAKAYLKPDEMSFIIVH